MIENREKVIRLGGGIIKTGYLDDDDDLILHSFDDEPSVIWNDDDDIKVWYKDGLRHRDNNLPAIIYSNGNSLYYNNGKRYWFINNKEYYYMNTIKEKFKNNILYLPNVENTNILKDNGIDAIWLYDYNYYYLILDQSQYNLAVLKFL